TMYRVGRDTWAGELPQVGAALEVWASGGGTRTHRHQLAVDPIPVLEALELVHHHPAYAELEPEHHRTKPEHSLSLQALPGSRYTITARANRELDAIELLPAEGDAIRVQLSDGQGELASLKPGSYSLRPIASDGIPGSEQPFLDLARRTDQPPRAIVSSPGRDAVATASETIALALRADDDLGLRQIERVRSFNGMPAPELGVSASGTRWEWSGALVLPELGVAPGDVIEIGVVARDSKPPEGQLSGLDRRRLEIISEQDYNNLLLRRLTEQALRQKYMPLIKQIRELEEEGAKLAAEGASQDKLNELAQRAKDLREKVAKLQRKTPLFAIEPELQEAMAKALRDLARAAQAGDREALQRPSVADMLDSDLELMADLARAMGLMARLRQLVDAEQQTTERLAELAEHRRPTDADRVRMRELGDQEQQLSENITEWRDLATEMAQTLRDKRGAGAAERTEAAAGIEQLATAVEGTEAEDLKRRSARAARGGDGVEAHRLAAIARDRLLALLPEIQRNSSQCQGMAMGMSWCSGGSCQAGMSLMAALAGRGMGLSVSGAGLGGSGATGMGYAVGYGGDDNGLTDPAASLGLFGPEQLGTFGMVGDEGRGDGVAAMASSGDDAARSATGYTRELRNTTGTQRSHLSDRERELINAYRKQLER
nr:hypothetical protein [Planctomycetota bacterium]